MKKIIVGIDAGTTSAFAVIDFQGDVIAVKSRKNWQQLDLVSEISSICTPLVIACDTNPASRAALHIKACFGARLFVPASSLHVFQKHLIVEKLGIVVSNSHEPTFAFITCPSGTNCSAGRCVSTSIAPPSGPGTRYTCRDPDGNNTRIASNVTITASQRGISTRVYRDACVNSSFVREYTCASLTASTATSRAFRCPARTLCGTGACRG